LGLLLVGPSNVNYRYNKDSVILSFSGKKKEREGAFNFIALRLFVPSGLSLLLLLCMRFSSTAAVVKTNMCDDYSFGLCL